MYVDSHARFVKQFLSDQQSAFELYILSVVPTLERITHDPSKKLECEMLQTVPQHSFPAYKKEANQENADWFEFVMRQWLKI